MIHVIPILLAALFTITTAWSLGMILFRALSIHFHRWEGRLLAFLVGSACLSAIMFALCAARLVYRGVLLALGGAIIAYAAFSGAFQTSGKPGAPLPRLWRWLFAASFAAFTYIAFFNALAPEHSSDGMGYHLAEVLKYRNAHGFTRITTKIYANLSQGIELLFLFAFDFGRHSAAALVHFAFWVTLAFLMVCYGKRIGKPGVGVAGAIFTFASPVVLLDASIAYIDVALAAVLFAVFYLLQMWAEDHDPKLLVPIGILAGFAYAIKYTGLLALPYAVGLVTWKLWRERKPVLQPALAVSVLAAVSILPWMAKNWMEVANPVSPLANRLFPNPYVHISFEDGWRSYLSRYDLPSRWQIPLDVTVRGEHLDGFIGPLFLLAPLALLALRYREGRQLLLPAALFGFTYFGNIGARFLIPVIPFISLALALAASSLPWLLMLLVIGHSIAGWPPVCGLYCAPFAFHLANVPIKAALRLIPEETYLRQYWEYNIAYMMGAAVPPKDVILASGATGLSYLPRDVRIGYESASNEVLQDILWTPVIRRYQPTRIVKFDFPRRRLRKLRVIQTASLPNDQWSIAELRVYNGSAELPRNPAWRLTARPNPWDIQMAFDNDPVTRWRTWQPAEAGMYVEVDFGRPQDLTAVVLETSEDAGAAKVRLVGADAAGPWMNVADNAIQLQHPIPVSLRLAASAELKARGIRYVLINPGDPGADDFRHYPGAWGMVAAGAVGDVRLYRIK
jgi:hypothetical protein